MYRDDTCAVCGESLPPDHFYCREHAAGVDDRLHELGDRLPRLLDELARVADLLGHTAEETWDYVAESQPDDPDWPPVPTVRIRADAGQVDVDVDSEPGFVQVRLDVPPAELLAALVQALDAADLRRFAQACAATTGANATH